MLEARLCFIDSSTEAAYHGIFFVEDAVAELHRGVAAPGRVAMLAMGELKRGLGGVVGGQGAGRRLLELSQTGCLPSWHRDLSDETREAQLEDG